MLSGKSGFCCPLWQGIQEPQPPPAFPVLKGLPEFLGFADSYLCLKRCNHQADFSTEAQ